MHELRLVQAIDAHVLEHAQGRSVRPLRLTIGVLRQVVSESLRFALVRIVRAAALLFGAWYAFGAPGSAT